MKRFIETNAVGLLLLSFVFAAFLILGACLGCARELTPAEQAEVDDCKAEVAGINAKYAAEKLLCKEPGCEDKLEAKEQTEIKGACQ